MEIRQWSTNMLRELQYDKINLQIGDDWSHVNLNSFFTTFCKNAEKTFNVKGDIVVKSEWSQGLSAWIYGLVQWRKRCIHGAL